MKKTIKLLLLLLIIPAVFMFSVKKVAAFAAFDYNENDEYYYYNWYPNETYSISNLDYNNYIFEYYRDSSGWQELNVSGNDIIKLKQSMGYAGYHRYIYINNQIIASGSAGMSGPQTHIDFRYKSLISESEDPTLIEDINQLPQTAPNRLGKVSFTRTLNEIRVKITYDMNVYFLEYNFDPETTDLEIFNYEEAYFTNNSGKPQIIINLSDRYYLEDILLAPDDEKPAFVPHVVWDLKTNKIESIMEYYTYALVKQNKKGVIVAYVYIDEFIIDELLTVELSYTARHRKNWLQGLFGGKYTEWKTNIISLYSDEYLSYRNMTTAWHTYIPLWGIIEVSWKESKMYEMPSIHPINLYIPGEDYNITKSEVEDYFTSLNANFLGFQANSRHKLWALALQEGSSGGVFGQTQIYYNRDDLDDPHNFHIIHLTYKTNDVLYEAVGNDMDLLFQLEQKLDGLNPPEREPLNIAIIVIGLFGILIIFAALKANAFNSPEKALKFILALVLIGVFIYVIYSLVAGSINNFFDGLRPSNWFR